MDSHEILADDQTLYQEGATPLGSSSIDDVNDDEELSADYSDIISRSAFLGEYPFDSIIEGIKGQFQDYIGTKDQLDYVDIFYDQMKASMDELKSDVSEEHPQEILEALTRLKDQFVSTVFELFESYLTVTIKTVDDESTEEDEVEVAIRIAYKFFILDARDNFSHVIVKKLYPEVCTIQDDIEFYNRIDELLRDYDPFVRAITPTEFLQLCDADDIINMYDSGDLIGNFLRKYSAKLYKNESFKINVVNDIVIKQAQEGSINDIGQQ